MSTSPSTVRRLIREDPTFPCKKLGRRWKFDLVLVEQYMERKAKEAFEKERTQALKIERAFRYGR
jgi:hypothetical protein